MTEFFHLLHDDALISIGEYVGKLYGPEAYTRLALTCRKMKHLLLSNETNSAQTIRNIIQFRVKAATSSQGDFSIIRTLEELAIFEQWCKTPLHSSYHHIPFPLASLEVDESMHEKIFAIINIMERFPSITVQLDSHCGIIAPNSVATSFSRSRGEAVCNVLRCHPPSRVHVTGHGKRVANRIARCRSHPLGELAREGRGWVEIYIVMEEGRRFLPSRNESYYNSDDSRGDTYYDDHEEDNAVLVDIL
jgi:outer membrane protein OmpA-like peptidoglycan-associated protein